MGNNSSKPTTIDNSSDYQNADINDNLIELNLTNERGVAFIVSNEYLSSDKELHGSDKDSKKMEELFKEKEINYSVHVRTQVTYKKFIATCKYLATYEYYPKTVKTIVIYFSGHGGNGFITMEAEKEMKSTRVYMPKLRSMFKNTEIATLFLIDSCRGSESDCGFASNVGTNTTSNQSENASDDDSTINHASQGNDLVAYATSEGYVAYSDEDGGSWTNTLVLQLRKLKNEDIVSVLCKVNHLMKHKQHGSKKAPKFLTPEISMRLTGKIYLWVRPDENGINQEIKQTLGYSSTNEKQPSLPIQPLANEQSPDTLTPAGNSRLMLTPAGNGNSETQTSHTSDSKIHSQGHNIDTLSEQVPVQATRGDRIKKKSVYVLHREDSEKWVMSVLKPIFDKLNIDMFTPGNFVIGRTKANEHIDFINKVQVVIAVFSELAVKDTDSEQQKWFKFALDHAISKNPDPSSITVIPVLHGDISCDQLPPTMKNLISVKTDDRKLESKIQRSIFS